jgi:CheY-like chemotaxis protein
MVVYNHRNINDLGAKTPRGCYNNESKLTFGSLDPKYYDEIITKLNLQTRKEYEHNNNNSMQHRILLQNQKTQEGLLLHNNNNNKKKKRILLVDDEIDICIVYQIVLQDAGYECVSYTDSLKALQEFKCNYYDLILLDIKMPVLNGFELCKKIREVDKTIHIIFITASEAYYEKFRSQHFPDLGKINYIQKPIGNQELVQIVNTILANSITIE